MSALRIVIGSVFVFWSVSLNATAQGAQIGKDMYQRCAACHLPNGAGVPGAFPALRKNVIQLASNDAGRDYLTYVVRKGISGAIEVDGATYRGVMPAVTADLTDDAVAALLNYMVLQVAPREEGALVDASDFKPFAASEIADRSNAVFETHTRKEILMLRAKSFSENAEERPEVRD